MMRPRDSRKWSGLLVDRIAYLKVHQVSGPSECALEDRDLQGGPAVLVTAGANLCRNPEGFWWAPDGRLIFSARRARAKWERFQSLGGQIGFPDRRTR